MTTRQVSRELADSVARGCRAAGLRPPSSSGALPSDAVATFVWEPDLTAAEQATVDTILRLAVGATLITPAEHAALNVPNGPLPTLRAFQQMSQSDFIALAQNARDRALFDNVTALIRVIRALMRD